MPLQSQLLISFLDLVLGCLLVDAEDCIVILLSCLLGFLLGSLDLILHTEGMFINVTCGLEVSQGLFMISESLVYFSSLNQSFSILGVQSNCFVETDECVLVLLEFVVGHAQVEVNDGVVANIVLVDLQALLELRNSLLSLVLLEEFRALILQVIAQLDILNGQLQVLIVRVNLQRSLQHLLSFSLLAIVNEESASSPLDH